MKIKLTQIIPDPNQPRKTFDDEHIENIRKSINRHGFVSQIVVRPHNDKYMIIAGENRWRAAKLANLIEIECDVREKSDGDAREMQLIENYHRKDVPPFEVAQAIKKLRDELGLTQEELGQRIGIKQQRIAELESLLQAACKIQNYVKENKLDTSTAYEITRLENEKTQLELAEIAVQEELPRSKIRPMVAMAKERPDLSADEIATYIKQGVPNPPEKKPKSKHEINIEELMKSFSLIISRLENLEAENKLDYENMIEWRQTFINAKEIINKLIQLTGVVK